MNPKATLVIQVGVLADILKKSNDLSQVTDNLSDYFEEKFPCIFDKDEFYEMMGLNHGRRKLTEKEVEERINNLLKLTRAETVNTTLGGHQQEYNLEHTLNHIMRIVEATK